ncbi:MFS transporter [Terracoccus luteus]|uniref:MFS family permease n=1 Tax=Terracoccus luteus TaxID=53356 RepID=A0A495Y3J4_9MICO|nr:MFS transporter [Terracoccus luteus]MBB2986055.1 MFS family permease [Terracoccus luteus]MCP2171707.1 MFS family permease [Terracoccus luteus]RKT78818.1 putative MFS family arabinose efflux permease [Terracoccus luteus]
MTETPPAVPVGGAGAPGGVPGGWRSIAVSAYGPSLLSAVGSGAVMPVVAVTARGLGASVAVAALAVAAIGVGQLLGDLPSGALAARIGERRALLTAAVVEAVGMALCALAGHLALLFAGVLVIGLAGSLFGLARQAYLTEAVPVAMRARALSTLGGVTRIGAFIGPFIGAFVIARSDVAAAYVVGAVAAGAAFLLVLLAPDITKDADGAAAAVAHRSVFSVLGEHRFVLLTLGTGALCISGARAVREALVPLWAESQGLTPSQTALVFGVAGALDMLLFYPSGWLMDRYGRVAAAVPSMVVLGIGMMVLPLATGLVAITLAATVLGLGNGIGAGLVMTLGADASPAVGRTQFLGGWRLFADVGRAAGPLALSGLSGIMTLGASSVVLGVGAVVGAGWLRVWVPRHDPTRRHPTAS